MDDAVYIVEGLCLPLTRRVLQCGEMMTLPDDDIQTALSRSGYLLEQRVEAVLSAAGMETKANTPMTDPLTGKARETDLRARWVEFRGTSDLSTRPAVGAELLIECVRSDLPLIFYERAPNYATLGSLPTLFGFPLFLEDPPGSSGHSRLEDRAGVSWWATLPRISTQWNGFDVKHAKIDKNERSSRRLVASQRHDLFRTIEKLAYRAEAEANQVMSDEMIRTAALGGWLIFVRPVLVVGGPLLAAVLEEGTQRMEERRHVHHVQTVLLDRREVSWMIDVITEQEISDYLGRLRERMRVVEQFCLEHAHEVQTALKSPTAQWLCRMLRPRRSPADGSQ